MVDRRIAIIGKMVLHPKSALNEIASNGNYFFISGIVILFITSAISGIFNSSQFYLSMIDPEIEIFNPTIILLILTNVLTYAVASFAFIIITYFIAKGLKGNANFKGLLAVIEYASAPAIAIVLLLALVFSDLLFQSDVPSDLGSFTTIIGIFLFVGIGVWIWVTILTIIACREANDFSTKKAFGVILLSGIVLAVASWSLEFLGYPMSLSIFEQLLPV